MCIEKLGNSNEVHITDENKRNISWGSLWVAWHYIYIICTPKQLTAALSRGYALEGLTTTMDKKHCCVIYRRRRYSAWWDNDSKLLVACVNCDILEYMECHSHHLCPNASSHIAMHVQLSLMEEMVRMVDNKMGSNTLYQCVRFPRSAKNMVLWLGATALL